MWLCFNYCEGQVPHDKRVLCIGVDETSVCLFQGERRSNVFVYRSEHLQRASLAECRTYLTHVVFVCDEPNVHAFLPQFIIANEHTLGKG